jgi:hypothetical protein
MLTRLFLLCALLLGVLTPPDAGQAGYCVGQAADGPVGQEVAMAGHEGHQMPSPSSAPTDHRHRHCPPMDCPTAVHCVQVSAPPVIAAALPPAPRTSYLALRTATHLLGRTLEPPTPPPNRLL